MILIPFFTQKTWNELSQLVCGYFLGSKQMAEKIFIIPIFSHSQQFTQRSTGLCAEAKGPEGPWEPELGGILLGWLCRKYRLHGSAEQPGGGPLCADFKCGMEPIRSNRGNGWQSVRNSLGKPWRIKERQNSFLLFLAQEEFFFFPLIQLSWRESSSVYF